MSNEMAAAARASPLLLLVLALVAAHVPLPVRAQDTVAAGRPLSGDGKLVSRGGKFALGFFQPDGGATGSWYVGIWYNNIAERTPVWVANRERPVSDPAASRRTATSPCSTRRARPFDHIGDTWLLGGKLRRDKATGVIQGMTSWRARGDPAPGPYTLQLDPAGAPQYVLRWNGTREYWLTGDWNGRFFAGAPEVAASGGAAGYAFRFVDNDRESYFTYNFADNSTVYRFVTDVSGQVKGWYWVQALQQWNLVYAEPKARCVVPRTCGAFGVCSDAATTACGCARGFAPRDAASWSLGDHTGGCVRNAELRCGGNGSAAAAGSETKADRFFRMDDMRLPDGGRVAGAASSGECERACLGDYTCSAYAYNGSCVLWNGELQNLADGHGSHPGAGSLYLRLAASEFPRAKSHRRRTVGIAVGALAIACFVLAASILIVRATMARRTKNVQGLTSAEGSVISFKYSDLQSLTKNFSDKLGGGAFGSVFRGQLPDGTALAVKKLEGLRQGEKQFRAKGGDRKLLVYEFMPNGSLDRHLFGATLYTLSWRARHHIAVGVAKGLAYLHDKCRDCIIHCDVKPENILLDADFAPKVADFGLAKLVGRDFSRVLTTMRGTIGYLAPEWIGGEAITAKADVFSYGMMLFEIVSGRRNVEHGRSEPPDSSSSGAGDHATTATSFFPVLAARRLAEAEGDVMDLLDPELGGDADVEEVRRVCKVACWCIQHGVDARPTMAEVVQALEGLTDFEMPPVPRYLEVLAGRTADAHAPDRPTQ
ncbi:hypothetical protein PVAP13_3NG140886 [Panicum virgatum]|uniref:non-specific serine/threonine protein kinase n=1 Tax=Panicum virgatum TaxID=38727 RepID=A0A8T0UB07_PANVG|nr:hypothetical protein PVAP13_3NG140886 [Panicum virgatum]